MSEKDDRVNQYIFYISLFNISIFSKSQKQWCQCCLPPVVTISNKQSTTEHLLCSAQNKQMILAQLTKWPSANMQQIAKTTCTFQNLIIDSFETKCSQTVFMGFVSARLKQILINSITPLNIFLAFLYICLGACPGDSRATWHAFVYTMLEELRIWGLRSRLGPALV